MFEACLHLMNPSEADELVHVLVFEQEAWPPASGLLQAGGQLLVGSHLLVCWGGGRGKRPLQMQA